MERGPTKAGVLTVVVAVATALSQGATATGGAPADVPVRTTIADSDASGPLRVRSDGNNPDVYETTTVGAKTTVTSMIYSFQGTSGQDFFLTTYYPYKNGFAASSRTVGIDLAGRVFGGGFSPPDLGTTGQVPVQLSVKCRMATPNAVSLVGMTYNQSVECPGALRFWAPDGQWYRFSFQPEKFSNSDRWKVTCSAVGSSGCTKWKVEPSGSDGESVNTLLRIDLQGTILEVGDDYRLTFSILVER